MTKFDLDLWIHDQLAGVSRNYQDCVACSLAKGYSKGYAQALDEVLAEIKKMDLGLYIEGVKQGYQINTIDWTRQLLSSLTKEVTKLKQGDV